MSKDHTFLSGPNINPGVKQYCKEHDETFIYYCMECNSPICKICVIKNTNHTTLLKSRKQLTESKLRSKGDGHEDGTSTGRRRHLKELIDKKVESLVKSVKEEETKNLQILQSNKNEIKAALNKAKEQQKFYQDSQGIKDTTKLVQKLKQIKSQIDKREEIHISIMPSVKYVRQKVAEHEIEKLFGELTFG
ncbi:unnamed protein product [Mytilus edulis]|uniref:B box-type domain-containing protein n=1 Tax=Mytilus edulis TaxID=6550 RepID=A0A8S3V0M4_MYTED|nr:unnamed protein product [Mytilus edulis]